LIDAALRKAIMAKSNAKLPAGRVALYDKLIATNPGIERKGDANPYTSVNGNMFTLLHESRLAIPLPEGGTRKFPEEVQDRPL
jgi:hypothetical protein